MHRWTERIQSARAHAQAHSCKGTHAHAHARRHAIMEASRQADMHVRRQRCTHLNTQARRHKSTQRHAQKHARAHICTHSRIHNVMQTCTRTRTRGCTFSRTQHTTMSVQSECLHECTRWQSCVLEHQDSLVRVCVCARDQLCSACYQLFDGTGGAYSAAVAFGQLAASIFRKYVDPPSTTPQSWTVIAKGYVVRLLRVLLHGVSF